MKENGVNSGWMGVGVCLLAGLWFALIAPTLHWQDFTNGMENFNVLTAQETAREGHWLLPTMNGQARTAKPPLAHWITAGGILSSPGRLEFGARWPSLLMLCLMLPVVYGLGKMIGDWRLGLTAVLVCASTMFFFKYARRASYDTQLTFWVALTNYFLALILLRNRWWIGCAGAGLALGGAMMTKGPVALTETVLPALLFGIGVLAIRKQSDGDEPVCVEKRLVAVGVGLFLMALVGLPWVFYVMHASAAGWGMWLGEVSNAAEAKEKMRTGPFEFLIFIPHFLPWVVWLFVGAIALIQRRKESPRGLWWMMLALVVPIGIIIMFPPVRERYLLPMVVPASILAAWGLLEHFRSWAKWTRTDTVLVTLHWIVLGTMAIGLPVAGILFLKTADGLPWYPPQVAIQIAGMAGGMLAAGIFLHGRWKGSIIVTTVILMFIVQGMFFWGYRATEGERSPIKAVSEKIAWTFPDADVYNLNLENTPREMAIYMNRPVRVVASLNSLEPTERTRIVLIPERMTSSVDLRGKKLFDSFSYDNKRWLVYVLPGRGGEKD